MARNNSKKRILKSAQKAANSSTLNAVARNKQKGSASSSTKKSAPVSKAQASKSQSAKAQVKKASPAQASKKAQAKKASKASSKKAASKTSPAKAKAGASKAAKTSAAKKKATASAGSQYSAAKKQAQKAKSSKSKKKGRMSTAKKVILISIISVVIVIGLCCAAFAASEESSSDYVPAQTILDGQTDVTGMTEPELRELLTQRVKNSIGTTITLNVGDTNHQFQLSDIGSVDIDATIEQAFAPYHGNMAVRFFEVAGEVLTGVSHQYDICTMCIINPEALNAEVNRIAANNEAGPKNAGYAYDGTTNTLVVTQAKQGVVVDVDATIASIQEALSSPSNGDPKRLMIQAEVEVADPESYEPGQAIFVDTHACQVHLYENGAIAESFPCTPGTSGYSTPTGDFTLAYKDGAPTWYNPHSDWSSSMAETIPPGPSNPLGVRALAVSCGNGIFIHGTTSTGALGSPGSHGCVRLSNENIIKLYDRVSEGIPIIIR